MPKKRILIVDDEEDICISIKLFLEDTNQYEVRAETQGTQALPAALEFNPDLIILDLIMPDMDGGEVEQLLKGDNATKNIPIIFLTAMALDDDPLSQGRVIDGRFIIGKPVTMERLVESVSNYLKANPKLKVKKDWDSSF